MKINITNYEEYFLLYADKELSVSDKEEVEMFVEENPALKEEFMLICEAVCLPEVKLFPDKNLLFKKTETFSVAEYHELVNLYIDNELSNIEKLKAEKVFAQNELLQKELQLLNAARFQPDLSVTFADKRSLYKNQNRVIPIFWTRIAAAAIILGFGIWFTIQYNSREKMTSSNQNIVRIVRDKQKISIKLTPQTGNSISTYKDQNEISSDDKNTTVKVTKKQQVKPLIITPKKQPDTKISEEQLVKNTRNNSEKKLSNDLPKPDANFNRKLVKDDDVAIATPENNTINSLGNKDENTNQIYKTIPISYVERDENNDDTNNGFAEQEFHKSKLGRFFKKASRTIMRNLKAVKNNEN